MRSSKLYKAEYWRTDKPVKSVPLDGFYYEDELIGMGANLHHTYEYTCDGITYQGTIYEIDGILIAANPVNDPIVSW